MTRYLHGFAPEEQARLIRQAEYWRETFILPGLDYRAPERVLEIGCGAGAVLGVLLDAFPGIGVAGIDLSVEQIDFAREYLAELGHPTADLRVGNGAELPWDNSTFDHVYLMWVLEHLQDAAPILAEANRVLKPGGSIGIRETDYYSFRVLPRNPDWEELRRAQFDFFSQNGDAEIGLRLGPLLVSAGFAEVTNELIGFHFFQDGRGAKGLRAHVEYMEGFLGPALAAMSEAAGASFESLTRGLAHLRSLPDLRDASLTQDVYRAHGRKPVASDPELLA